MVSELNKIIITRLAAEIVNFAQDRILRGEPYQNLNSAIHGSMLEIKQVLMDVMADNARREMENEPH
jgi:hypothetical protein